MKMLNQGTTHSSQELSDSVPSWMFPEHCHVLRATLPWILFRDIFPCQRQLILLLVSYFPGLLIRKYKEQALNEYIGNGGDIYSLFSHIWVHWISFGGCFRQGGARFLNLAQFFISDDVKHSIIWWSADWVCSWVVEAKQERKRHTNHYA